MTDLLGRITFAKDGTSSCPDAMKDLCHDVRNACLALAGVIRHMPNDAERVIAKRELKRIEDALLKYRVKMGYNHERQKTTE